MTRSSEPYQVKQGRPQESKNDTWEGTAIGSITLPIISLNNINLKPTAVSLSP